MYHLRRNKSELMVLTGAIYAFVAYLTAFALEILFLVDLTRQGNEFLATQAAASNQQQDLTGPDRTVQPTAAGAEPPTSIDRFAFEALQAHTTIACLTIAILYFIVFITSLILIVALILRSSFMLLIWMCAMATLYLPEFGLVSYVALYTWGLSTRNGQTELIFYLLRAILNLIFIMRARKLWKQWNYEKNFFRLGPKSMGGGGGGASSLNGGVNFSGISTAYDSPYFISAAGSSLSGLANDSLSTTINPIFSSSTLNLNRYDFVRDQFNDQQQLHEQRRMQQRQRLASCGSPETQNSQVYISSSSANSAASSTATNQRRNRAEQQAFYARDTKDGDKLNLASDRLSHADFNYRHGRQHHLEMAAGPQTPASRPSNKTTKQFYLGDMNLTTTPNSNTRQAGTRQSPASQQRLSVLSLNDDYADYELDLDYRTLDKSSPRPARQTQHRDSTTSQAGQPTSPPGHYKQPARNSQALPSATTTGQRFQVPAARHHEMDATGGRYYRQGNTRSPPASASMSRSYDDLAYSTQSLDRRHSRDFTLTEQVVLQPLGHQPFEYLQRPGSTTNLNYR